MKQITESDKDVLEGWRKEAKEMTAKKLPKFIKKLCTEYNHDYGTICHAMACAGVAGMYAVNSDSKQGGITGFQAGAVMWETIKLWGVFGEGPKRMLCLHDMLYPQYESKFRTISQESWDDLQKQARKNIHENVSAVESVRAHWRSIINGKVPFGYRVENENRC